MAEKLTPKQRAFVDAYLGKARGNGAEAARIAGYSDPDVSAFDCKRNPVIRAHIDAVLESRSLSAQEVLAELTDVARAEWRDFLRIITNPVTGDVVDAKILLGDKVKALELLGKYHRLFIDKVEHGGPGGGPIQIANMTDAELDARLRPLLAPGPGDEGGAATPG